MGVSSFHLRQGLDDEALKLAYVDRRYVSLHYHRHNLPHPSHEHVELIVDAICCRGENVRSRLVTKAREGHPSYMHGRLLSARRNPLAMIKGFDFLVQSILNRRDRSRPVGRQPLVQFGKTASIGKNDGGLCRRLRSNLCADTA